MTKLERRLRKFNDVPKKPDERANYAKQVIDAGSISSAAITTDKVQAHINTTTTSLFNPGTYAVAPTYSTHIPPYIPQQPLGPMEGLDELCQLLGVAPTTDSLGLALMGQSGQIYSLVDVLASQLKIMETLHVLLVHRHLIQETGE